MKSGKDKLLTSQKEDILICPSKYIFYGQVSSTYFAK